MSAEPHQTHTESGVSPGEPSSASDVDGERVERTQKHMMTRRRAMQTGTAIGVSVMTVGMGATVSMAASGLDFDSDLVQNPKMTGAVTVRTHKHDFAELDYDPDGDDDHASLKDMGVRIAEQDEDDAEDDVPYNPVTLRASNFDVEIYRVFPRDETYEDGDGDTVDLNWIDAETHWSTDESATDGTISVTDKSGAVEFAFTHGSDDSAALATFTDFLLEDGLGQNYLQLVLDVDALASGAVVDVVVRDTQGNEVSATIDPSADAANDDVIAAATGESIVYQTQFADLTGIDSMEDFDELEIQMKSADATITVYGLDIENPSRWDFGTQEYTDADDDLDTQTIREPEGDYSITSIETVEVPMEEGDSIEDVEYDIEYFAGLGSDEMLDWEIVDAGRQGTGELVRRFRGVYNFEPKSDFELIWNLDDLVDENFQPSNAWIEAGFETGLDELATLEDFDDDDLTLTSRTSEYSDASLEGDVEITTTVNSGEVTALVLDHLVTEDDEATMTDTGAAVGPTDQPGGGGIIDMILSVPGMIVTAVGVAAAYTFGWIPGLGGN